MAAEAVVSFVIERLGDLIVQKLVFLKNVQGQVEELQDELVRMRCFLKDADQKQDEEERIRNWVAEIRAAAYDAQDVIEIFISKIESLEKKRFLSKWAYHPMRIFLLNKVGKEIEALQARNKLIAESREKYGIRNLGEGSISQGDQELQQWLRRSSPMTEEQDIVGFEEKTNDLVAQLLKEERRRCVVSIFGMGGVGKTTLAKKVYNHADVRAQFHYRAWVCISGSYKVKEVLQTIIKQVKTVDNDLLEKLEKMDEQDMEQMLHQELRNERYLVVLDDIWKEETWDCFGRVFPDTDKGSRLLITSRNKDVPLHADARSCPYELKTLGPDDSWLLFVKKAFSDGMDLNMEDIGREITRRCGGLPLAITIIGGLLLRKEKLKSEWEKVVTNMSTYLSRTKNGVSAILELSYADLPPHLKFCFLYLGFFPEDYEIAVRRLIHMWTAEGIIQNTDAQNLEEIAEYYLEQLINRNLVQVAATSVDERVQSCRMHDLLRELAIRKAKDEHFLQIVRRNTSEKLSAKSRYYAVHCHSESFCFSAYSIPHLRTLLFFNTSSSDPRIDLPFTRFKLLRVLDLEDMNIKVLPKGIGEVCLLRYLSVRNTEIRKLPHSLSRLHSLQTLDIFNPYCWLKVSNIMQKLENLRHLYVYNTDCKVPLKFDKLRNLQTLSRIDANDLMHNNMSHLTSLRKLGIWLNYKSEMDKLCSSLAELANLHCLSLYATAFAMLPSLDGLSSLGHVTELKLTGPLNILPNFPPYLSRLSLKATDLIEDPMPILEKLRLLSTLKLNGAYNGKQITVSKNGFHQLKFLEFRSLHVEEIKLEKGAMAELRCLRIRSCADLKLLPEELKYMTALVKLELVNMPDSFVSRTQGVDSYKVCNVSTVTSLYRQSKQWRLEKAYILRRIRAHAQALRSAYLFKAAGEMETSTL